MRRERFDELTQKHLRGEITFAEALELLDEYAKGHNKLIVALKELGAIQDKGLVRKPKSLLRGLGEGIVKRLNNVGDPRPAVRKALPKKSNKKARRVANHINLWIDEKPVKKAKKKKPKHNKAKANDDWLFGANL